MATDYNNPTVDVHGAAITRFKQLPFSLPRPPLQRRPLATAKIPIPAGNPPLLQAPPVRPTGETGGYKKPLLIGAHDRQPALNNVPGAVGSPTADLLQNNKVLKIAALIIGVWLLIQLTR